MSASVAIVGAGKLGTTLARLLVAAGHDVRVSATGDPERTAFVLEIMVPGARALALADALDGADAVILALPLSQVPHLDPDLFVDRLVLDATNHWASVDGALAWLDGTQRSSEIVQRLLPAAQDAPSVEALSAGRTPR